MYGQTVEQILCYLHFDSDKLKIIAIKYLLITVKLPRGCIADISEN
jgi:hypothetical protein